jgi:predicted GNAT family acetyltransferase
MSIDHDAAGNCFRTPDGAILSYTIRDGRHHFDHTVVPPQLRGQGVASKLAAAALEHARKNDWRVVPDCSYIDSYIRRHKEFADLVQ